MITGMKKLFFFTVTSLLFLESTTQAQEAKGCAFYHSEEFVDALAVFLPFGNDSNTFIVFNFPMAFAYDADKFCIGNMAEPDDENGFCELNLSFVQNEMEYNFCSDIPIYFTSEMPQYTPSNQWKGCYEIRGVGNIFVELYDIVWPDGLSEYDLPNQLVFDDISIPCCN